MENEELKVLNEQTEIMREQLKKLNMIKNWVVFFGILTLISIACVFGYYIYEFL